MNIAQMNPILEFGKLNFCIQTTKKIGEIATDDAETLTFFLELVEEALANRVIENA